MDRVDINFEVYVQCMTFNHAPYIVDAMDGFCIQNTNFPYVCVVMDDASTDGEQDEIRNYLQDNFDLEDTNIVRNEETKDYILTFARHKTNHNCFFAVYLLKYNHYSIRKSKDPYLKEWKDNCKYIALCEGDDYWTDSNKLQLQVNYLNEHNDCGLVYSQADIFSQNDKKTIGIWGKQTEMIELFSSSSQIPTLTTCFRKSLYYEYLDSIKNDPVWVLGDVPLWLYFMHYSKVFFIPQVIGCYRLLEESASHSNDFYKRAHFIYGAFMCRQYYAQKYKGTEIARKVARIRVENMLNHSFNYNKSLKQDLLKDLINNKIFNIKIFVLILLSKFKLGRYFIIKQRTIRVNIQ